MADDNNLSFSLDLDASEFAKGAKEALDTVAKLGDSENLAGLLEGFAELGIALGVAGAAVLAFKTVLDLTEEGENIERIEKTFESLSEQAGISGEALKNGLQQASGGLISTNDLLQVANKAIVQMGASAANLPQVMELARKSTAVMGGDLKTNFEDIVQAISSGNARMLQHLGIVVDQNKAYDTYAKSLGITVGELDKTAKQTAIMNAVLSEGAEKFKGVDGNVQNTQTAVQQLGVAFTEVKEAIAVFAAYLLSGPLSAAIRATARGVHDLGLVLNETFGTGAKQTQAHTQILTENIAKLQDKIAGLNSALAKTKENSMDAILMRGELSKAQSELEKYTLELKKVQAANLEINKTNADGTEKTKQQLADEAKARIAASKVSLDIDIKANAERAKLNIELVKAEEQNVKSFDQIERLIEEEADQRKRAHMLKLNDLEKQYGSDRVKRLGLAAAENRRFAAQEEAEALKVFDTKMKLLKAYQQQDLNIMQGIQIAAHKMALQARADMEDNGKRGEAIMGEFQKNSTSAFQAFGTAMAQGTDIAQAAANAMKGFFLNMLADRATAEGSILLASGIGTVNPVAIAEGGALLAIGAALRSVAGSLGAGSSSSTPSVSGGAVAGPGGAPVPTQQSTADMQAQQQQNAQRAVTINIAGNYLNSQASQRTLMEIMRNETDATGFTYNSVGVR